MQVLTQGAHTHTPMKQIQESNTSMSISKTEKKGEETAKSSPQGQRHRARPAGGGAGALQAPSAAPCDGYELARLKDAI